MFDWTDDPITKLDLLGFMLLNAFVIFGAFEHHREKTVKWLPNLLRQVRDGN
jgi:hypothetical protein